MKLSIRNSLIEKIQDIYFKVHSEKCPVIHIDIGPVESLWFEDFACHFCGVLPVAVHVKDGWDLRILTKSQLRGAKLTNTSIFIIDQDLYENSGFSQPLPLLLPRSVHSIYPFNLACDCKEE